VEHHRTVDASEAADDLRRLVGDRDSRHQKKPSAWSE
jgi:hypothetical protein